jgi:hypothetical protein
MKHFGSNEHRAAAFAAHNLLGKMLKADGTLPPAYVLDVSGMKVEITLPPNTEVERWAGENGDGTIKKKATQNSYGYAVLFLLWEICRKFNQHKRFERILRRVISRAIRLNMSSQEAMLGIVSKKRLLEFNEFRASLELPLREEATPRRIKQAKTMLPTVGIFKSVRKRLNRVA